MERYRDLLSAVEFERLLLAVQLPLPSAIRINTLKIGVDDARRIWPAWYGWRVQPVAFCDAGWQVRGESIAQTLEHKMGFYYIQDAASMLTAEMFSFEQDAPLVLDDVSIRIRPGQFAAFVGPSGAGKSTLLRLLLGFETPSTGSVYYDGEDLAGLDHQSVRSQMGVVLANSQLTPGTLLSNIVGSSELALEDAWEAARLSGLDTDIAAMPMQMYTVITEGESTLSGGQRQRLLIARAIVSKPKIMLLDEATSALDNKAQAMVTESMDRMDATRIVIAHRLSTVMNADKICYLEGGRIAEMGT